MSSMGRQTWVTPASLLTLAGRRAVVMLLPVHMVVACSSNGGAAGGGSRNRGNDLQGRWSALCSRGSGWRTSRTSSFSGFGGGGDCCGACWMAEKRWIVPAQDRWEG